MFSSQPDNSKCSFICIFADRPEIQQKGAGKQLIPKGPVIDDSTFNHLDDDYEPVPPSWDMEEWTVQPRLPSIPVGQKRKTVSPPVVAEQFSSVPQETVSQSGLTEKPSALLGSSPTGVVGVDSFRSSNSKTCDICHKKFTTEKAKKRHQLDHLATSKKYKCPHCAKQFSLLQSLKGHLQVHQEKLRCPQCSREYSHLSSLEHHIASFHTDRVEVEVYRCVHPNCTRAFKNQSSLKVHMSDCTCDLDYHGPYNCPLCTCKYRYKRDLRSHLKKVHKVV